MAFRRVMAYSCQNCDNTGIDFEREDGCCTCPFGRERRIRVAGRYRAVSVPPMPLIDEIRRQRPAGKLKRLGYQFPARNSLTRPS